MNKVVLKNKEVGPARAGGLRLKTGLWNEIEKLAAGERRKFNQYVEIVLEDHVKAKSKK